MYRKTYVKIDNQILTQNIKEIKKHYNNYKYYIGVVKANAYGHGDYIINDLIQGGINYLAVSSLEEALHIREYNTQIPILVLEPISLEHLDTIQKNNITITIESLTYALDLSKKPLNSQLKVHLKLDTGMNRLGFKNKDDLNQAITNLKQNKSITIEGIYTHIATSGINDIYYDKSIQNFKNLTSDIDLSKIPIVHLNRSITLVHHQKLPFETGVRLGIIMYGFNQSLPTPTGLRKLKRDLYLKKHKITPAILSNNLDLHTAFSLYSEVISIREVKSGEYVGYGANYIAKKDILVATIPIGYNDGIKQSMKYVSINNKLYPFVGDICMDMIQVQIDDTVKLHDQVEIFGKNIKIKDVSRRTNSNAYHILTGITTRVPRLYSDNTEIKY